MIKTKLKNFNYNGFSLEKLTYMLSFDFDINFIVGGRANYKTSTLQQFAVTEYMEKRKKSIRLVRNLDSAKKQYVELFFSDFVKNEIYKKYGCDIEYEKGNYFLVWKTYDDETGIEEIVRKEDFMRVVPLSKSQTYKSNGLEVYKYIIFDEFAPEELTPYLKNEIDKLIGFISTVNRNNTNNDLKLFLIGNMISVDNLYFTFYGIDAFDLVVNNIYDYTIEGFQRVGVFVVEPVFDNFKDAPRILRTTKQNTQETSQNKYDLPENIIDINDVFLFMFVNDIDSFNRRFKIRYIIDVSILNKHQFYFVGYEDKYNDNYIYFLTTEKDNSDIYITLTEDYLKKRTTHTNLNSCVPAPVWRTPLSKQLRFLDRNARKLYYDLKEAKYF